MNDDDPIGKSLGVSPMQTNAVTTIIAKAHDDSAIQDFESARANIVLMVDSAKEAIDSLSQIATSSQHPRAFEVLAKLIDTGVNASKSLLELQSKIREIKQVDEPINSQAKTINNNLFVGSTAELQKIIKQMKNEPTTNSEP